MHLATPELDVGPRGLKKTVMQEDFRGRRGQKRTAKPTQMEEAILLQLPFCNKVPHVGPYSRFD